MTRTARSGPPARSKLCGSPRRHGGHGGGTERPPRRRAPVTPDRQPNPLAKHLAARDHLPILRQPRGPSPFVATDRGSWHRCRTSKATFSADQLAPTLQTVATRGDASSGCRTGARCPPFAGRAWLRTSEPPGRGDEPGVLPTRRRHQPPQRSPRSRRLTQRGPLRAVLRASVPPW